MPELTTWLLIFKVGTALYYGPVYHDFYSCANDGLKLVYSGDFSAPDSVGIYCATQSQWDNGRATNVRTVFDMEAREFAERNTPEKKEERQRFLEQHRAQEGGDALSAILGILGAI